MSVERIRLLPSTHRTTWTVRDREPVKPYKPDPTWISALLRKRYSENSNDTGLHRFAQQKLYARYSSSQDYYFTNVVNTLVEDKRSLLQINFSDLLTMLDDDEYLKRFYYVREYDMKMRNLAEYYKFHKDIPRFFKRPASDILDAYLDKKRNIDYKRIKQILMQEAAQRNMKVAMNKHDNEIR
jgi:hypothetical protein